MKITKIRKQNDKLIEDANDIYPHFHHITVLFDDRIHF